MLLKAFPLRLCGQTADCRGHPTVGISPCPIGCKPLGLIRVYPC